MKRICETLEVSRSNIAERCKSQSAPREKYKMADDVWLLPMIRELVDKRPTYGYRRIQTHLNKALRVEGKTTVNHKRVYRIMKQNKLLLARYTGRKVTP